MACPVHRLAFAVGVVCGRLLVGEIGLVPEPILHAAELRIGSVAPPLDVEFWVQDGGERFGPVREFEKGKVYVLQFWQTWSVSCTGQLALVARVQSDWAGEDVRVIGVSNERVETVRDFLRKDDGQGKTYGEITKGYTLATDPDGSVHADYLGPVDPGEALRRDGNPYTFIVGKKGEIEWFGHPREMEEPLAQIVEGTWDRAAFLEEMREIDAVEGAFIREVGPKIAAGLYDDANVLLDRMVGEATVPRVREKIVGLRHTVDSMRLGMAMQAGDELASATFARMAKAVGDDAAKLHGLAALAVEKIGEGFPSGGGLLAAATAVAEKASGLEPADGGILDTLAHLQALAGRLDEAVATQRKAVALGGPGADAMKAYLETLEAKAAAE